MLASKAVRCHHVAHALLAAGDKALEAWAMFGRAQQRCGEAAEQLRDLPGGAAAAAAGAGAGAGATPAEDLADLKAVAEQAAAYK